MAINLEIHVLGPLAVLVDGEDATPTQPKQRALLGLLLLRADEVVTSDELIEALWTGRAPQTAQTGLRVYVGALRRLLGPDAIETHPGGYRLRAAREQTDIGRVQRLAEEARGELTAVRRAELLRAALGLFRGEPLVDFRYEAFAHHEILRLEELRLLVYEELAEAELDLGRHREFVPELDALSPRTPCASVCAAS